MASAPLAVMPKHQQDNMIRPLFSSHPTTHAHDQGFFPSSPDSMQLQPFSSLTPSPPQNSFMPRSFSSFSAAPRYEPPQTDPYYYPAFATPPRANSGGGGKKKAPKKADGKQPTFLTKLYAILETPEYHHIIRWDEDGAVIIIEKPDELAEKILPLVYRQSRFASFSRQLNIYGWMRKVSLRHIERGIVDPDASTWTHAFLRRNSSKDELINFKRRVPPRPSQSGKPKPQDIPMTATELEYASDAYSSPDAYHQHLFDEQHHQQQQHYAHSMPHFPPPVPLLASPLPIIDRARPAPIAISQMNPTQPLSILPQTAPLHNTLITTPVVKGHNRTRSYQCNSPLNPNPASLALNNNNGVNSSPAATPLMSRTAMFNPLDPSTWARRGFTDFQGNPMPASSSLSSSFGSATSSTHNQPPQQQQQQQGQWTPSPPPQQNSSPTTPALEGTISPAVFRPGYTGTGTADVPMPSVGTRRPPFAPGPAAGAGGHHGRTLSLGDQVQVKFPTIATRRATEMDGLESMHMHVDKKLRVDDDNTLPSASAALKGFSRSPFDAILPEQDEPMT